MTTATETEAPGGLHAPVLVGHVTVHYPTDAKGNYRLTYRDAHGQPCTPPGAAARMKTARNP